MDVRSRLVSVRRAQLQRLRHKDITFIPGFAVIAPGTVYKIRRADWVN
jgi:hypothetical protein